MNRTNEAVKKLSEYADTAVFHLFMKLIEARIEDNRDLLERTRSEEFHKVQGQIEELRIIQHAFKKRQRN